MVATVHKGNSKTAFSQSGGRPQRLEMDEPSLLIQEDRSHRMKEQHSEHLHPGPTCAALLVSNVKRNIVNY